MIPKRFKLIEFDRETARIAPGLDAGALHARMHERAVLAGTAKPKRELPAASNWIIERDAAGLPTRMVWAG